MPVPSSIDDSLEWMRKHFDPERARGVHEVYEVDLRGSAGGRFHVCVEDGALIVGQGPAESPGAVFRLADVDWFGVLAGRENADLLYMAGRLEVDGDLAQAGRLRKYFR